jgi:hypothetical protein
LPNFESIIIKQQFDALARSHFSRGVLLLNSSCAATKLRHSLFLFQ